jgi:hypothetical protein
VSAVEAMSSRKLDEKQPLDVCCPPLRRGLADDETADDGEQVNSIPPPTHTERRGEQNKKIGNENWQNQALLCVFVLEGEKKWLSKRSF